MVMVESRYVAAAAVPVGIFTLLLSVCFWRRRRQRREEEPKDFVGSSPNENSLSGVVVKIQPTVPDHLNQVDLDSRRRPSNYAYTRGVSEKPLFDWSDHPMLVNNAVENGWSQFAFTPYNSSSPSSRSMLLGLCSAGDDGKERNAEISWEVCQGSGDFMQTIRLNPGLIRKPSFIPSSSSADYVIRAALPLPGPPLGSFPQEAYFEITILSIAGDNESPSALKECERTKLIQPTSESPVHFPGKNKVNSVEEIKVHKKCDERGEGVKLSVGLSTGGYAPSKLPGSYPGSIGFNSDGSVLLDGMKLVFESEKEDWGRTEKVIGCGFEPIHKKVFFTVDSELVHVIHCKSEEFGSPLYPTIAAKGDVMVLVNFGQSVFKYLPAQRTANPCFVGAAANGRCGDIGYEDSRELFSMGMIDSHWFDRSPLKNTQNDGSINDDDESSDEIELFEIVVEEATSI